MDAILRGASMQMSTTAAMIGAENTGEAIAEGNWGTVIDARAVRRGIPADKRVLGITPHDMAVARRLVLPRNIRKGASNDRIAHFE